MGRRYGVADASDDNNSEWRIGINPQEARRVIPLHLYLAGGYFLDGRRQIAGQGDPAAIPDSAAYAAYNAGLGVLHHKSDPDQLRNVWEGPAPAAEATNFTKDGQTSVRINVLLFRYLDEVLSQSIRLTDRR